MHLHRRTKIQLAIFTVIALLFGTIMVFGYMNLPAKLFGIGRYTVTMELPQAGGLYPTGNVTYRGTKVGRVEHVGLTDSGVVNAVLSLQSGTDIPSDLKAEVHSQSAIGEQYVELLPRSTDAPPLRNGDTIALADTSTPPNINDLLAAANSGLQAIPQDNLKTAIDEAYIAIGGLGPEISRIVKGSTKLAADARHNLDPLTTLIDQWQPVVNTQTETSTEIRSWASHLATVTTQLRTHDADIAGFINDGAEAAAEVTQLFDRLTPTLPVLLANLVSVGQVALHYQPNIEQLLVLLPQGIASLQGISVANKDAQTDYKGAYLSFNLNLNLPPACTTGFLPSQQRRTPASVDYPDRAPGDLYCRIPQDATFNVRGARNQPCATVPGKRAPTVRMCESDEHYIPLNDGFNWKGDPNATLSGQDIPQLPPGEDTAKIGPAPVPALATAEYDPATGTYFGPDGQAHTRADLAHNAPTERTWQSMLTPPSRN